MEWWIWVLLVAIVAVVAFVIVSRRPNLQERFGSEYDRALEDADSPREARHDLRDRLKRHRKLDLRPLSPDAARAYAQRWFAVQSQFVDDPSAACREAGTVLDEVLRERGYPVDEDFDTQADLVSVDHPNLVTEYRTAHEATTRGTAGASNTEDLRIAFVAYRNLFATLLDEQTDVDEPESSDEREIDLTRRDTASDEADDSVSDEADDIAPDDTTREAPVSPPGRSG